MAARTSTQAGNWSASATWGGNTPPGIGDTATIAGHAIIVDVNTTVGTSPSDTTTIVLQLNANSSITVAAGKTFGLRGNAATTGSTSLTLSAGAALVLDFTANSGQTWMWTWGTNHFQQGVVTCNGTSGARCSVSKSGTGTFGFTGVPWFAALHLVATYTDFTGVGSATVDAFALQVYGINMTLDHCTVNSCGVVEWKAAANTNTGYTVQNTVFTNSLNSISLAMWDLSGTGVGTVTANVFDNALGGRTGHMAASGNVFLGGVTFLTGGSTSWTGNFHRLSSSSGTQYRTTDWSECYMVVDGSTYDGLGRYSATAIIGNPHWTTPLGGATLYAVSHCIFDSFGSDAGGDVDYGPNSTPMSSNWTYNIGLPDQAAPHVDNPGTVTTCNGFSGAASYYEHNTWCAGNQGAVATAEGGAGFTGMLASVKSNIFWASPFWKANTSGNEGPYSVYSVNFTKTTGAQDIIAVTGGVSQAQKNCLLNMRTDGDSGQGAAAGAYNRLKVTVEPGATDIIADPQFVDPTRNFSTWAASLESSWPAAPSGAFPSNSSPSRTDYNAHGLYKISLQMSGQTAHADYDSRYTLAALKAYVRAGFAPKNLALKNAGHDGATIGAVEVAATTLLLARRRRMCK